MRKLKQFTFVKDNQSYAVLLDGSYVGSICGDDTIGWYIQGKIKQNDGLMQRQTLKRYPSKELAAAAIPEEDYPQHSFDIRWFEHKNISLENTLKWQVTVWERISFRHPNGLLLWVGKSNSKEELESLIHKLGFIAMTKKEEFYSTMWCYSIKHRGKPSKGFQAYTDNISIQIASGDPGGNGGKLSEFQEYLRVCLLAWYEGAKITLEKAD